MHAPSLTRRRALALGTAAGLSSLLTRAVPEALASRAATAPRGFGLPLPRSAFGADRRTAVLRAPRRFDVVGVRGAQLAEAKLEVRVRRRGAAWSPWVPLGAGGDHRPDTGTGDHASDPVWAGGADELQLRTARHPRGDLRLHFVAVPAAAKRRGAAASVRLKRATTSKSAHGAQAGAPAIIPRADWGGDTVKPRAAPEIGDVQVAFVHHTVTANDYGREDSAGIVLGMAKYHRDTNGWNDLGYNFVVDKYGQIFEGRAGGIDQAIVGAQAQGYNSHSTGIANIGTFSSVGQTPAAIESISRLIAWKLPLHGAPVTGTVVLTSLGGSLNRYQSGTRVTFQRISGHRDGDATECPGNALYAQLPAIRQRTAELAPAVLQPVAETVAVTLNPPVGELVYGERLALSGVLSDPTGGAVAGQSVAIQKQRRGTWVTISRTTTDANGAFATSAVWRASGAVRARAVIGSTVLVSPAATVECLPRLEASAKTSRVRAGRALKVSGSVHPIAPVTVVVEKQAKDGTFRKVRSVTFKPRRSAFEANVALREPGLYRLTPRTGRGKAKASASALYVRAVTRHASLSSPSPGGMAARG